MRYEVLLTEDAEQDLEDLYAYIAKFDSPKNADYVPDRLLEVTESLATSPERESQPKELRPRNSRISSGVLQALSGDLSRARQEGCYLRDRRWASRYAEPAIAPVARRLIFS
jgi:plasmid stabilization system protein ParE